jgi:hypothetical protein
MSMPRNLALAGACIGMIASACSGSGSATPVSAFQDGSRLKAVYGRIDGASPVFLNWYDTGLGVDCRFMDVGFLDRLVCFPSGATGNTNGPTFFADSIQQLFGDSACTQPVVNATFAPCEARFFATTPQLGDACGTLEHLFNVGPVVPRDPAGLYHPDWNGSGACVAATASDLDASLELHALGAEIPLESLVSGTYQHDAGAGRIVPLRIAGSDGSIQGEAKTDTGPGFEGESVAWDNERGEIVSTSLRPGSRWFPKAQYQTGLFSDPACSVPTAIGPACGVTGKEALTGERDACGYPAPATFYELGAPVADQSSVYFADPSSGACMLDATGASSPVDNPLLAAYGLGAPVPVTAFAGAAEVHTGTGQIQIVQAAGAGGPPATSAGFFDTVHGQPCTFARNVQAADGVVRCLPAASDVLAYGDADCTLPLYAPLPASSCVPQPAPFVSVSEQLPLVDGCYDPIFRSHIYPVLGANTGHVYERVGDQCFDVGAAADWSLPTYVTGAEIPPSEFAAMDIVGPG